MPWIAAALDDFLADPFNHTTGAVASQKSILRHALSPPSSFVCNVLPMFFQAEPYNHFIPLHCENIYRWFSETITATPTSLSPRHPNLCLSDKSEMRHEYYSTTPQLHLLLLNSPDTPSDSGIHKLRSNSAEITSENWYLGAVVYSLFATDPVLTKLPDTCGHHLTANPQTSGYDGSLG
jgi:hypothetical protein